MQIDKKTIRNVSFLIVGCIFFYWLLHETERFRTMWKLISGVISPFVIGATLAFIMNVPLRAIERNLMFIKQEGLRRTASIILTLLATVLVIYGVITLLRPLPGCRSHGTVSPSMYLRTVSREQWSSRAIQRMLLCSCS